MPVVDVRDVATCHLEGLKRPEAANQRFICAIGACWTTEIHKPLLEKYNENYPVQTGSIGKGFVKFLGLFVPMMKMMGKNIDVDVDFENKETKECLGITEFISWEKSVVDLADSLIELNYIPDLRGQVKKRGCC